MAEINPLGDWTGGTDVDTGATNRKLGSDMADSVTGGGLHGKDLSKADVSVNIYAWLKAQKTREPVEMCCAIGDETVDGIPYSEIVETARAYIESVGGFGEVCRVGSGMLIEKRKIRQTFCLPTITPRKDLKPGDAEYEKLKRSIEQFGYVEPVIWNKATGRVVGGHQRLKVLMDMGMTEVDCVVVEMDEDKEKALNIALNKISGDWDKDKLALLIADLQGADFDVSFTGFEPAEIDDLFKDTLKDGVKDDDFDVGAELEKPTMTKPGDIWMLGRHRLICGDSTKAETYDLLMGSTKANLVITDPPYNVNYEGSAGKIKNDNMADDAFYNFLLDAYTQMHSAMADDASIYVFHADTEGLNFRRAFADAGFFIVWLLHLEKAVPCPGGALLTSGSTNPVCTVGRKTVSTSGTPAGRKPPSGKLTSPRRMVTIRP